MWKLWGVLGIGAAGAALLAGRVPVTDAAKTEMGRVVAELLGEWIAHKVEITAVAVNNGLPEIVLVALMACGFGMMISGKAGEWGHRAALVLFGAIIWRIVW